MKKGETAQGPVATGTSPEVPPVSVTGPPSTAPEPIPAFLLGNAAPPTGAPAGSTTPFDMNAPNPAGDILVESIAIVHDKLADATKYEGWRLSEREVSLWQKVVRYLLRSLPKGDWPVIIMFVSLLMSEGGKVIGYMRFRKEHQPDTPRKAPAAAAPAVPAGALLEPSRS